ncbi:MAG: hypothetical protein ACHQVK_01750 [Candidatus Paceibacterales bacterium]
MLVLPVLGILLSLDVFSFMFFAFCVMPNESFSEMRDSTKLAASITLVSALYFVILTAMAVIDSINHQWGLAGIWSYCAICCMVNIIYNDKLLKLRHPTYVTYVSNGG